MRAVRLISWSVLVEAIRRREIYAIVLVATLIIAAVMMVDFFRIEGLTKFYREVALQVMSLATGLAAIMLAARQLPREFENRTIYPLLAKPIGRMSFLLGKLAGVMLASLFCLAIFMSIYVAGTFWLKGSIPWMLFLQYLYLQCLMLLILATLAFWLSMLVNVDAAVTMTILFFFMSEVLTSATSLLYDDLTPIGQYLVVAMTFAIPQLALFDLSGKAVHATLWQPLPFGIMLQLTLYGLFFASLYFAAAAFSFRRRPL